MAEELDEREEMEYDEIMEILEKYPHVMERVYKEQVMGYRSRYHRVMCSPPSRDMYIMMKANYLNEENEPKKQIVLHRGEVLHVIGIMPYTYDVVVQSRKDRCFYALEMWMYDHVAKPEHGTHRPDRPRRPKGQDQ